METVLKITDNEGKTMDRYTVYFESGYMLMMSENPKSPQGVCMSDTWKQDYIDNDAGKEVNFDDLPERVQDAITDFIFEE
jgi:hypothetical protein